MIFQCSIFHERVIDFFWKNCEFVSNFEPIYDFVWRRLVIALNELFMLAWIEKKAAVQSFSEFFTIKKRNAIFSVWFVFSNCSFVCEWYVVEKCNLIFNLSNIVFQKSEKNFGFLSKIMFFDKFQSIMNNLSNKALAHVDASHVNFSGIIEIFFEILHVTVSTESMFFERATIKSITMVRNKMVEVIIETNFL